MRTLRIDKNSKSVKLVNDIIKSENMDVNVVYTEDALGDSKIVIQGDSEEVNTLEEIYNMIK